MLMSDIIKVLGTSTLKEFPWGCVVKDTLNLFTTKEFKLTETSTAADVAAALDSLPEGTRGLVLKATIDSSRRCVTQPLGGGMVVEHTESEEESAKLELMKAVTAPKFVATSMLVLAVICICLTMVFNLSANDNLSWSSMMKAVVEVFTTKEN